VAIARSVVPAWMQEGGALRRALQKVNFFFFIQYMWLLKNITTDKVTKFLQISNPTNPPEHKFIRNQFNPHRSYMAPSFKPLFVL
jgi:hypothetical protein